MGFASIHRHSQGIREEAMDVLLPFSQAQSKVKLGRTMIYKLMAEGDLERIKIGTRTFITESSLNSYIERTISDQRSRRAAADTGVVEYLENLTAKPTR